MNVCFADDFRLADQVAIFASKGAKDVNRSIFVNVPLPFDLGSAKVAAIFALQ